MDYPDMICTNDQYEEVDCDDPSAHFRVTKAQAKAKQKELGKVEAPEPEAPSSLSGIAKEEGKAIKGAPQNKAIGGPKEEK